MRKLLATLLFALSAQAHAAEILRISCDEEFEKHRILVSFNSAEPEFTSSIHYPEIAAPKTLRYLSPTLVCGVAIDFAKSCKGSTQRSPELLSYAFECADEIRGEVTLVEDGIKFTCAGAAVPQNFKHAVYFGCKELR